MLDRFFADIDRARAEAAADFAAGVSNIPISRPKRSTAPAPHPFAVWLRRLVLLVVLATIGVQLVTGHNLWPVLVTTFSALLLVRMAAQVGLLPTKFYRSNSWTQIGLQALFLTWYLAITFYPALLAIAIPVLLVLRWPSVHRVALWAMRWQELRRLRAGKPPTAPLIAADR